MRFRGARAGWTGRRCWRRWRTRARLADADADQDAVLADELAAAADGRMSPPDLAQTAALAVEHMSPGAAQARVAGGCRRGGGSAG